MPKIHSKKDDTKTLYRKISNKLTLFKMKDEGRLGETCDNCKWRKVTSQFSRYCTKCTKDLQ